mgnify:CR=1 FL=1
MGYIKKAHSLMWLFLAVFLLLVTPLHWALGLSIISSALRPGLGLRVRSPIINVLWILLIVYQIYRVSSSPCQWRTNGENFAMFRK